MRRLILVQAKLPNPMSFDEFLAWYPEDGRRFELIEGRAVEMLPTGPHEDVAGFISAELNFEIRRQQLPYSIPHTCLLRPRVEGAGYVPDVVVVNRNLLKHESLWPTSSVIQRGETALLAIEVVSTNWRDDYGHKLVEYEAMGIAEYWIVDFRSLGAVRHIGKPKQPTITVCQLENEEYKIRRFLTGEKLASGIFPQLKLTADSIFTAAD